MIIQKTELPGHQPGLFGKEFDKVEIDKLKDRFIFPPFSILDTRQGEWQGRKRQWISLGIKSEIGRGGDDDLNINENGDKKINGLTFRSTGFMAEEISKRGGGTSIFDPVLCELMYKWFCPDGGVVVDPFAGGSVRGIVASKLGLNYFGVDLSKEQIKSNREQANNICERPYPSWFEGDSINFQELAQISWCNFIFSCPPYHDLEIYSDDPRDLSNMSYDRFLEKYTIIIKECARLLRTNSFACFVVSEIRNKYGFYKNFVADTIGAFKKAGMKYYNEIILINTAGSLPIRITRQFNSGRKIGRCHQNVLIFKK